MKAIKRLILLWCILIPALKVQAGNLWSGTDCHNLPENIDGIVCTEDTLPKGFNPKTIPLINTELKVCDVVKQQNIQLRQDAVLKDWELDQSRKETKKERKRRIVGNVIRTTIEIGVIIILIII